MNRGLENEIMIFVIAVLSFDPGINIYKNFNLEIKLVIESKMGKIWCNADHLLSYIFYAVLFFFQKRLVSQ